MRLKRGLIAVLFLLSATQSRGDDVVKELVANAQAFIGALDQHQKEMALFPFNSEERLNWHYVPRERKGLPYKEMKPEQRELAAKLLKSVLSAQGYEKAEGIRSLEDVLKVIEGGKGPARDPELYYFSLFGEPSETGNWGFRYEGHHMSLHWTVVNGKVVSSTPQFMGTNPAEVREGDKKGTRVLTAEEDLGRKLVQSLDEKQKKDAILEQDVPADVITGDKREAAIEGDLGLSYGSMTPEQQGVLISLVQVLADVQRPELAEERVGKVRAAGLDKLKFAWIGGLERGQKHYYRVQGPTFVIEYDNTQNDANHIHIVWRDFKGDFGEDMLKEHYQEHADPKHPDEHKH